jgi:hypothetical protein
MNPENRPLSDGNTVPSLNPDPLLTETAAGIYIGGEEDPISERTLQRWRLERFGPAYVKIGRLVRYRKSALDAFLCASDRPNAA